MNNRYILKFSGMLAALFVFAQICNAQLPSERKIVKPANPFQTSGQTAGNNRNQSNVPVEKRVPSAQVIAPKPPTSMPNSSAFVPHNSGGSDAQKKSRLPSSGNLSKVKNMKRPQTPATPPQTNF